MQTVSSKCCAPQISGGSAYRLPSRQAKSPGNFAWFVSQPLRQKLKELGFTKIVTVGRGNYTFAIGKTKQKASSLRKVVALTKDQWGIDVAAR